MILAGKAEAGFCQPQESWVYRVRIALGREQEQGGLCKKLPSLVQNSNF